MDFKVIDGGVTAAKGFLASGIHCGVKEGSTKKDLALIYSEVLLVMLLYLPFEAPPSKKIILLFL